MVQTPFTKVPCWCIEWQQDTKAPTNTALIMMALFGIYENRSKLHIVEDEDKIILTTKYIENNLHKCVDGKAIRRALIWLNDQNIVEYNTNNKFIYIKFNFDELVEVKQKYNEGIYKDKFFIIYHYATKVGQDLAIKAWYIPIILSKYIYEVYAETFESNMSVSYVQNKFYNLFTKAQERHANKLLIDAGYIEEETPVYKTDCGYCKPRYFTLKMDKIEKEIIEFNKSTYINDAVDDKKSNLLRDSIKSYSYNSSVKSKDRLDNGVYTQEEKEAFRRQAEELTAAGEQWLF